MIEMTLERIPGLEWTTRDGHSARADGLVLEEYDVDDDQMLYRIAVPGSPFLICYCPCCGSPLISASYAMIVADNIYPFPVRVS